MKIELNDNNDRYYEINGIKIPKCFFDDFINGRLNQKVFSFDFPCIDDFEYIINDVTNEYYNNWEVDENNIVNELTLCD